MCPLERSRKYAQMRQLYYSRTRILANFGEISIQRSRIKMIMTNFLTSCHQYRNAFSIPRFETVIAVNVYHIDAEMKLRLQFLEGGNHILTQMAVLPGIYRQRNRSTVRSGGRHIIYFRHSFSW